MASADVFRSALIVNNSPDRGLAASDAAERLHRYGPNVLPSRPARSPFLAFLDQFRSLPVLFLLASGGLSLLPADSAMRSRSARSSC
jgi:P-type Ca2+ transporter type 2C